jgi:tetratricopeptide (TPR) repeat protein
MGKHSTNFPTLHSDAVERKAHQLYAEGLSHHHQGDLNKAAAAYEQVLRLIPKHFGALHHVGILAFQGRNYELAAGFIRSAIAVNGTVASAHSDLGNAFKELGQSDAALRSYGRAIELDPGNADSHYNLGSTLHALGRHDAALASYDQAILLNPGDAQAYNNRAVVLKEMGQHAQALQSCQRALALQPDYAEARNNQGNVLRELGEYEAALECYESALALDAGFAQAYGNRGAVLDGLNRPEAALASYDRALQLQPGFAEGYHNRALLLCKLKRWEAALADSRQAITLKPDYAEAYAWLGKALHELQEFAAAVHSCDTALRLGYESAELYDNRGNSLKELRQYEAALASIEQALSLKDDVAMVHNNHGNVLWLLERFDEALRSYDRATVLNPGLAVAHHNRGLVLGHLGAGDAALDCFARALSLNPNFALARWNRALFNLRRGNFRDGWPEYESRWEVETLNTFKEKREIFQPLWLGTPSLEGATILLHAEQGLGDTLQFCRYVKPLADLGARVILEVQAPLVGLLAGLPGVSQIVARGQALPDFDYHCPLMSLPLAFQTDSESIPGPYPYLTPDPKRVAEWAARLGTKTKPRVGLVWSGNPRHKNDHNRSIGFAAFAQLVSDDCEFISLQKEVREADRLALEAEPRVLQFGAELGDFTDTAALCELLDVVITVDTSVAHLAGALGKDVRILLGGMVDWRWLDDRLDSPWYPTARLYRQQAGEGWDPVLERVKSDLGKLVV